MPSKTFHRWLFIATILTGSVLLFMVQPLVARLALPRLGGAPAVWNSAMLVYQALLLAGYAYAHALSRLSLRWQAGVHLAVLIVAGLTLPLALADLPSASPGWEVAWVPFLLLVSIGPVFFAASAQAPLMQSWYAADKQAGDPYWLYAASNFGSFAGLLAYPLLLEPNFALASQSLIWSGGFVALVILVALAGASRWNTAWTGTTEECLAKKEEPEAIPAKRIALWLALAAVPSGLMLSTTTHLTTDIVAMPLLWVIPLGLYLLSYVFAFNEGSRLATWITRTAPLVVLLAGSLTMVSSGGDAMTGALASVALLFVVAVALHRHLYQDRPPPSQLTLFYLIMSAGGALGGLFTALIAPAQFDWVWEHPLLVLAAAALLPKSAWLEWMDRLDIPARHRRSVLLGVLLVVVVLAMMASMARAEREMWLVTVLMVAGAGVAMLLFARRPIFLIALLALMLGRGGFTTMESSFQGARERSFFGIYEVREDPVEGLRGLTHGTTLHGLQFTDPTRELEPTAYYGRSAGVGLALANSSVLAGEGARIGVVGLGVGTLACYRQPSEAYEFFEIDPAVLRYSQDGSFTFIDRCAPDAPTFIGDARLVLEGMKPARYDMLVIDAFSSDAIPLHLVTREAFAIYERSMTEDGVLLVHISNRFIDLAPMIAAIAEANGLEARMRQDTKNLKDRQKASLWVALSAKPEQIEKLERLSATDAEPDKWSPMPTPSDHVWTDDFASILPFLEWKNVLGL